MLRTLTAAAAFLAAGLLTAPAHAFTLDFVALAAGNEGGAASFDYINFAGSGVDVTVTARDIADVDGTYDDGGPFPYLDDLSGGDPGGLGVCPQLDCAGSPEDNIRLDEVAMVAFSEKVEITSVTFWNGGHDQVWNAAALFGIAIDTTPSTAAGFPSYAAAPVVNNVGEGFVFSFIAPETYSGVIGDEWKIYVSAIEFEVVPAPSSLLLLGFGVSGLALLGRRRA